MNRDRFIYKRDAYHSLVPLSIHDYICLQLLLLLRENEAF